MTKRPDMCHICDDEDGNEDGYAEFAQFTEVLFALSFEQKIKQKEELYFQLKGRWSKSNFPVLPNTLWHSKYVFSSFLYT